MPASAHIDRFDLDIVLRDASCDTNVPPVRRAIAALCLGVGVDDAYLSVRELREAVSLVHENAAGGRAKLAGILSTQCDDFGHVRQGSLIAFVKLACGVSATRLMVLFEVGELGRLSMALDRLSRPMWCSRSPVLLALA